MATTTYDPRPTASLDGASGSGAAIRDLGATLLYVALAIIFLWIGAMKFTAYEAQGIAPFATNSPLTSWLYPLLGQQGVSNLLGVYEIATGLLLLCRWSRPTFSALGGLMAVVTFLVTLSFMLTTPGVAAPQAGGFPALSAEIGQFLAKDLGLLAIALFILGDSLLARPARR